MDKELIKALRRHDVKIITSSDAHTPEDVGYKIRELVECILLFADIEELEPE